MWTILWICRGVSLIALHVEYSVHMTMLNPRVAAIADTIGGRCRRARTMAGIEQIPLAEAFGISRNTISNYENGKTDVPAWVMIRYAEATGVSLEWLAYGRNAKAPAEAGAAVRHEGFEPPTF